MANTLEEKGMNLIWDEYQNEDQTNIPIHGISQECLGRPPNLFDEGEMETCSLSEMR